LKVEYWFASDSEAEVARFDDASVNGSDRDLKDAFAQSWPVDVPFALKRGKHAMEWEVFSQGMNVRPVVMKSNTPWIRVPLELDTEPILDFAFLPVQGRQLG
jgi:hypothetical protein